MADHREGWAQTGIRRPENGDGSTSGIFTAGIFSYGIAKARETQTNLDWFMGGGSLPFWVAGLSMFATNV
ncbi:hypothetical protein MYX84_13430 [Acidobacteria bacterium AH-259-O06]|nr:hypothetical protein [Acidobacteria bacterium AH-259-O06]